jgi:hypothetical protein
MDKGLLRATGLPNTRAATVIGAAMLLASASSALAQGGRLEGTWGVTIQRIDCTTNAPQGPPVRALTTFHQGGTLNESSGATAFAHGQRSTGHGVWGPTGGGTLSDRTVTLLLFDTAANTPPGSPGFLAGWEITSHTYTLTGADSFTATGSAQFFDLNRTTYRSACTTRAGERVK